MTTHELINTVGTITTEDSDVGAAKNELLNNIRTIATTSGAEDLVRLYEVVDWQTVGQVVEGSGLDTTKNEMITNLGTITVEDSGFGMTEKELITNLEPISGEDITTDAFEGNGASAVEEITADALEGNVASGVDDIPAGDWDRAAALAAIAQWFEQSQHPEREYVRAEAQRRVAEEELAWSAKTRLELMSWELTEFARSAKEPLVAQRSLRMAVAVKQVAKQMESGIYAAAGALVGVDLRV